MSKSLLKKIALLVLISIPSVIRMFSYQSGRIHGDDMITGYFSAHYDLLKTNFFSPIPQAKVEWVSQFPTAYFFLQKLFFLIFGETIKSVRLSVIPYVFIISFMLYLIVRRLFDRMSAVVAILLYSFFPMSLYLETLGLHFISSCAVFITFFYFCIQSLHTKLRYHFILVGILGALCYLFYTSSYIALPMLFIFFLAALILKKNKKTVVKNYSLTFLVFFIILSPFFFYMVRNNNFYLLQRFDQVNLVKGSWSGEKEKISHGKKIEIVLRHSAANSIKSLYTDNIGGGGGYNFGHLAFFNRFTLWLFIVGIFLCFFFIRKRMELLFVLITIILSFVAGVVLTIAPVAYHRFSIATPFIIIVMSAFFHWIWAYEKINLFYRTVAIFIILVVYINSGYNYFLKSITAEVNSEELKIANLIHNNYPGRSLYVASFPGFVFQKIFYFVENYPKRTVITDYHDNLLRSLNQGKKYIYVIIFPSSFNDKFQQKDKSGKIVYSSKQYSLFAN